MDQSRRLRRSAAGGNDQEIIGAHFIARPAGLTPSRPCGTANEYRLGTTIGPLSQMSGGRRIISDIRGMKRPQQIEPRGPGALCGMQHDDALTGEIRRIALHGNQ